MQFAHPHLLWLLPVVPPALILFFWWSEGKRQQLLQQFVQARLLPNLLAGISNTRRKVRQACFVLAMAFIIVALARPQWGFTWEEVRQRGLDIVVAIDVSKSMLAEDIKPNRLARAKLAALDLMQRAKTDRLGLVAFAGNAFLQCPLTIDDAVFRQSVESLDVQSISHGGTAISEAISTALSAFTEGDNYKVLVLLTDGEDHDSGALETARYAVSKGLEIFTIGIGTREGELVRYKNPKSDKADFVRDLNGNAIKSQLNEEILQQLAGLSNRGFYLPLRGPNVMDTLYEKGLAPIPKTESGEKLVKRFHERYHWPLALAVLLLMVETLLPERKRKRKSTSAISHALNRTLALLFLCLLAAEAAHGSPRSAAKAYDSGDFDRALQEYKKAIRNGNKDPRLHFNAGDAAYRDRQLQEAVNQFSEALTAQDLELQQRAYYNRGNTLFSLGEGSPDPQNKMQAWQRSLKDYESALKLNPKDQDAAFNRDLVKRRLEELQQQQQNQQQQQQNQNQDNKDQQQQQNQNQQDQKDQNKDQKQDQEKQQQNKNQNQDQKQDRQQDPGQQQKQQQEQQTQNQDQQNQQQQQPQKQDQNQPQEKPGTEDQHQEAAPHQMGQMTPEQARRLLDAQKGDEKILQFKPEERLRGQQPVKDW